MTKLSPYLAPGIIEQKKVFEFPEVGSKNIEQIIFERVCNVFGIDYKIAEKLHHYRKREYVTIRQFTSAILNIKYGYSLNRIGTFLNGKDHASVLHSINTLRDIYETDKLFRYEYGYILSEIFN